MLARDLDPHVAVAAALAHRPRPTAGSCASRSGSAAGPAFSAEISAAAGGWAAVVGYSRALSTTRSSPSFQER